MARGGFQGSLHVGTCQCTQLLEFELPPEVFRLEESIYLGACPQCGRKYELDTSIVRGIEDMMADIEHPTDE